MKSFYTILTLVILLFLFTYYTYYNRGLQGEYFRDTDFKDLVATIIDTDIVFDTRDSFHENLPINHFSIKWSGFIETPQEGNYTFIIYNDDGIKLWVDGTLIIDDWNTQGQKRNRGKIALTKGKHPITIHYFEDVSRAVIKLLWIPPGFHKELYVPTKRLSHE